MKMGLKKGSLIQETVIFRVAKEKSPDRVLGNGLLWV